MSQLLIHPMKESHPCRSQQALVILTFLGASFYSRSRYSRVEAIGRINFNLLELFSSQMEDRDKFQ